MAKLYFRYGAMGSGKTAILLMAIYNFECDSGKKVLLFKPSADTKAEDKISSRIKGFERKVDALIRKEDNIIEIIKRFDMQNVIFVDEEQIV